MPCNFATFSCEVKLLIKYKISLIFHDLFHNQSMVVRERRHLLMVEIKYYGDLKDLTTSLIDNCATGVTIHFRLPRRNASGLFVLYTYTHDCYLVKSHHAGHTNMIWTPEASAALTETPRLQQLNC